MQDENVAQEVATGGIDFNDQELCAENNTAFHPVMIGDIMDLEKMWPYFKQSYTK